MKLVYRTKLLVALSILLSATAYSQIVTIGNGIAISVFSPLNRTNDYCVYEVVYLASEIGMTGTISALGFQKYDGTNTDSIENVGIYFKHTPAISLPGGNYDTTGYTLVYSGSFPNDSLSGWLEVNLDSPFSYNGVNNLQVLVSKGYQPALPNTTVRPRWLYTNISPAANRAQRYYGNVPISSSTSLATTPYTSNARLTFGTTGVVEINAGTLTLFPNPSQGTVNFYVNAVHEKMELHIYSSLGQLIWKDQVYTNDKIEINKLGPGIYFYSLYDSNSVTSGKLVVQ